MLRTVAASLTGRKMAAEPVRCLTKSLLGSRFVHPDHLGTPRVITASTALNATTGTGITSAQAVNKAVWRWDSDPFGSNATANSAPNENPNTLSQVVGTATLPYLFGFDLAFPGQKRDRETGKHYNYFRDYDPTVGRYVESDPIGLRGGLSTFGYVAQQPIRVTDPTGRDFWVEGPVPGEGGYPFHQSICVGTYRGARLCISFGVDEDRCYFNCRGAVYIDDSAPGPLIPGYYRNTGPSIDDPIRQYLLGLVGRPGTYFLIGNNCRNFSQGIFAGLDDRYFPPGLKSPPAPVLPQ
ncbi:MAG: RHS repeat-associated core domain-containing protein [Burkholderiales bacterium]|nr:RHS repeat-associated core domain-containing protein [Burkholderiales bacterium]